MESAKAAEKQCGMDKLSEVTENHKYLARLYKRYGEVYIDDKTVHMCLVEIRCLIDISILKDHLLKHRVIGTKQLDEITNHYHSSDDQVDNLLKSVGRAGGKHGYFLLYVSLCESSERHRGHEDAVDELKKKAKEMEVVAPESILCACRMLQQQKLKQDEESSAGEADLAESGYESDKKHSTCKCSSGGEADLEDESIKKHSTYKCSSGGDCTIYDYIKGSKCCMSTKNGFHSLCLPKSSYEELQLDLTLSKQSEVLLEKFADVAVNTFEGLSKIAFEDAQRYTNHLVSTGIYDSAVFSHEPITNCISETTSHKELEKELMENYYSWFNFAMIKNLRKKFLFKDGDDKLMQSYEDEFSQYCRRRCFESPLSFHPRPVSTSLKSLVFKTDANYSKYTLLQARKITVTVASIINSPDHAIYVQSVKEGCVEVSCYILPQFQLERLSDLQISQLKEFNIFSFKIEDKELMPKYQHQDNHFEQPETTSDSDGYDASSEEESDSEDKRTIIAEEDTCEAAKKEVSISEEMKTVTILQKLNHMCNYCEGVEAMKTMVNSKELNIRHKSIGEKGAVIISEAMKTMPDLQKLDLCWNSIDEKGAMAISEAMKSMANLQELNLRSNSIGEKGAMAISEVMKTMANLQELNLSRNSIGEKGAVAISEAMKTMPNLQKLDLSSNSIGEKGAMAISEAMKTMANLQKLDLSSNSIGEKGAMAISEVMKTMANLQELNLSWNSIGEKGAVALSEAMKTMPNLQKLELRCNLISSNGLRIIKEASRLTDTYLDIDSNYLLPSFDSKNYLDHSITPDYPECLDPCLSHYVRLTDMSTRRAKYQQQIASVDCQIPDLHKDLTISQINEMMNVCAKSGIDGLYMLTPCSHYEGQHTVLVTHKGRIIKFTIKNNGGKFYISTRARFNSLVSLLWYYKSAPIRMLNKPEVFFLCPITVDRSEVNRLKHTTELVEQKAMAGIVGSVNVELIKSYRVMLLKIANELNYDECQQISFVAMLPSLTCSPEPGRMNVPLNLMSTLESHGLVGPLDVDFLEKTLDAVGKKNLLEIIDAYKKKSLYKEAKKIVEEQQHRKKKRKRVKPDASHMSDPVSGCSVAAQELLAIKETEKMRKLKGSYATLLTQFSQMALLMRSAIESEDISQIEDTFLSVACDGDAITRTLSKNLSDAGIKCGSDSSTSSNSPVHSPTEEMQNVFDTFATSTVVEREEPLQHYQLQHRGTVEAQDTSSSATTIQRKKPIPLPRKKCSQIESYRGEVPPATPNKLVSCHQETHSPISTLSAATFHIPQSASTSCFTCSSDYSGDYSGGTGDSGVGDVRQQYVPSQKSLDELDPSRQQKVSEQTKAQPPESGSGERHRYMKLKKSEQITSDGYVKSLRAHGNMEEFLQTMHWTKCD